MCTFVNILYYNSDISCVFFYQTSLRILHIYVHIYSLVEVLYMWLALFNIFPVLQCYQEKKYVCILIISRHKWRGSLYLSSFILRSQCYGCWWPGNARSQDISSHGTDPVYSWLWIIIIISLKDVPPLDDQGPASIRIFLQVYDMDFNYEDKTDGAVVFS